LKQDKALVTFALQNLKMKKNFPVLLMAVFAMAACNQRDKPTAAEVEPDPLADSTTFTTIQWLDSTHLDLGTVKEGPEVEVAYRFRNSGNKPLIIRDVTATCGCTIPEKPAKPFAPGEEGKIKAKFNTAGRVGTNHKTLMVFANTKGGTQQNLEFQVIVEKKQ
jgi:hypothetical protein